MNEVTIVLAGIGALVGYIGLCIGVIVPVSRWLDKQLTNRIQKPVQAVADQVTRLDEKVDGVIRTQNAHADDLRKHGEDIAYLKGVNAREIAIAAQLAAKELETADKGAI